MTLYHGDCLDVLSTLAGSSVDAVIADPPYGTTACKWDSVIPFDAMWTLLRRVIKPRGAIVLFGSQPFTSALVMSNPAWFRYEWIWNKRLAGNPFLAKHQPLKVHENILVFSGDSPHYRPQMRHGSMKIKGGGYSRLFDVACTTSKSDRYHPTSMLDYTNGDRNNHPIYHPTQKPVALMSYLVRTYTNPGETVLDFAMGSGTTGVACAETGREFIGIEKEREYFDIAAERIATAAFVAGPQSYRALPLFEDAL